MQQQFEELKQNSISVTEDTEFYWGGEIKKLPIKNIIKMSESHKGYATGGKVIAYAHKGVMYITPRTHAAVNALRSVSYHEMSFFVPLSPRDMSFKDEGLAAHWQELLAQANIILRTAQDMRERRAELAQSRHSSARPSSGDSEIRWAQPVTATA